ncbi:hypothetical protein ACSBR2_040235 [Camellia fascicularis]
MVNIGTRLMNNGREPNSIMLADKNAPNEEVWLWIEETRRRMRASAVPVVSDSEGLRWNLMIMCYCTVRLFGYFGHMLLDGGV